MGKKIISIILSFILIIMLLVVNFSLIAETTILNQKHVIGVLEKNDYYNKIDVFIKEVFRNYILQSGLSEDILANLYSQEQLKSDINGLISSIYNNNSVAIGEEQVRGNLENEINIVLDENNKVLNATEQESIDRFIESIVGTYTGHIIYSETIVTFAQTYIQDIKNILSILFIISLITAIILIILLVMINKNIKYIIISIIGVGLMNIILYFLINQQIDIQHILIFNDVFSDTMIAGVKSILNILLWTGLIILAMGVILALTEKDKEHIAKK